MYLLRKSVLAGLQARRVMQCHVTCNVMYLLRKSVLAGLQARGRRNSDASRKDHTSYRTSSPTQPYASPSTRGWPQRTWPRRKDGGGDGAAEPPQPRVAHEVRGPPRRAAA